MNGKKLADSKQPSFVEVLCAEPERTERRERVEKQTLPVKVGEFSLEVRDGNLNLAIEFLKRIQSLC